MWPPRQLVRSTTFGAMRLMGAQRWLRARIRDRGVIPVLNLHSISPTANPFWPPIHPKHFDAWLGRMKRVFEFRTFATLNEPSRRPVAVLSFDDGYADFVEYAMPILQRHGLSANLNVITGAVESGEAPWNVRLYDWLNGMSASELSSVRVEGFDKRPRGDSQSTKLRFGIALSAFLKSRPRAERTALLEPLREKLSNAPHGRRMMTPAQVQEVARHHEIGSHSHSHDSMGFETNDYFQEDYARSREWLTKQGIATDVYAFPNGSYRDEQVAWLREARVEHVLLVDERFVGRHERGSFPRLSVSGGSVAELELASLGLISLTRLASAPS
jgi:peptidoglycan/xylan/chitin deacetylase (PgdA/CDA1 family)